MAESGLKIYFCGSIRGGRQDRLLYAELIDYMKNFGKVLTEHIGHPQLIQAEAKMDDKTIHDTDFAWLKESHVVVAEVTVPSTGVGYELGRAVEMKKPILAIYRRPDAEKNVSAMISGCGELTYKEYTNVEEGKRLIEAFLKAHPH